MIYGERIRLRAIEYNDLLLLVEWRNNPEIYTNFYEHEPLSIAMQQKWFDKFLQRTDEKFWIVETCQDSKPIGTIALVDIDWRNRKAEIGRVLIASTKHRSCGYGRELFNLLLEYAFEHLNLNRLYLDVFAENQSAVVFYRKMGLVEEGCYRQHVFAGGNYRDVLVYSIVRDEYLIKKHANKRYLS